MLIYQALQTGVVDGQENPPSNVTTQKLNEVQKHATLSNHGYVGYAVIVNKPFWDGLPADIRKTLEGAMADATTYEHEIAQKDNDKALADIRATGKTTVYELTDAEISETPDYTLTYPPHCLRGTHGAEKIAETKQDDPVPLALTDVPEHWLRGREFLLLKKHFDVFTNPNTDRLLGLLDPDEVIVFKRYDTDRTHACYVPHTAFTDPCASEEATPRASVEMRTISYWYQ